METQLYFWKPLLEEYQKELSLIDDYYGRTASVFGDIEDEAEKFGDQLFENYPGTEDTDPASVAEWAEEERLGRYLSLEVMKSNNLLMTISMLYHIWEQQLIRFTVREMKHYIKVSKKEMPFSDVQIIFKLHGVDIVKTQAWKKLRELKFLVNVIKHADGESADKLRKIRPDFFELEIVKGTDTLELYESALSNKYALQVSEQDLHVYINAAKEFWDEFPERAFSDTESLLKKLNKTPKQKDSTRVR